MWMGQRALSISCHLKENRHFLSLLRSRNINTCLSFPRRVYVYLSPPMLPEALYDKKKLRD